MTEDRNTNAAAEDRNTNAAAEDRNTNAAAKDKANAAADMEAAIYAAAYDLPMGIAEARRMGFRYYFTGRPCKRGHVDLRFAVNGNCRACLNEDRGLFPDHREGRTAGT